MGNNVITSKDSSGQTFGTPITIKETALGPYIKAVQAANVQELCPVCARTIGSSGALKLNERIVACGDCFADSLQLLLNRRSDELRGVLKSQTFRVVFSNNPTAVVRAFNCGEGKELASIEAMRAGEFVSQRYQLPTKPNDRGKLDVCNACVHQLNCIGSKGPTHFKAEDLRGFVQIM